MELKKSEIPNFLPKKSEIKGKTVRYSGIPGVVNYVNVLYTEEEEAFCFLDSSSTMSSV